jgi:hypothetical protein
MLSIVYEQILAGTVEPVALQEGVLAEPVVLPDRLEDGVACDVVERHSEQPRVVYTDIGIPKC